MIDMLNALKFCTSAIFKRRSFSLTCSNVVKQLYAIVIVYRSANNFY
jgi:hypothetical protein